MAFQVGQGRQPLLVTRPEIKEQICLLIAAGNYLETSCRAVGIDDATIYGWMLKAKEDYEAGLTAADSIYIDFCEAKNRAEAENEARQVKNVLDAAAGGQKAKIITRTRRDGSSEVEEVMTTPQWLAAMTFLERRHPDRWGRRDRLQVDQHTTQEIVVSQVEVVKDYGPGVNTRQPAGLIDTTAEDTNK